jgi:regulator of sirC expression with transglutaminase-like and TPR domain
MSMAGRAGIGHAGANREGARKSLGRFSGSPEFQRLITGGGPVHLARIALEIAQDAYPELDLDFYLQRIAELTERVRARCAPGAKVRDVLGQINWVLFVEEELRGNREDYYDPRNSYLNEVLDRRLGIPISLSVLYWAVAEPLGLLVAGVNLPAHFMLRVHDGERFWLVDPFHGGDVLDRSSCERRLAGILHHPVALLDSTLAACSIPVLVTRMLRNLKAIYVGREDVLSALPVQRRLAALNQQDADELRDLAMFCIQADRPGEALDPLQAYLDTVPPFAQAPQIRALYDVVRSRLAQWN